MHHRRRWSSSDQGLRAMPPPPPELVEDAIAEILLRLPPDEPKHLFRASLVCKPWLRVLTDPDFHRRYGAFHRTPPLLGFLRRNDVRELPPTPRLTTTTAAPLAPYPCFGCCGAPDCRHAPGHCEALDCHHGRVLLHVQSLEFGYWFFVWDPLTGEKQRVPQVQHQLDALVYSVAVFCAVSGCDHLNCHGGPFRVAVTATSPAYLPFSSEEVKATVYSSETGAWSMPVSLGDDPEVYYHPPVLGRFYEPFVHPRQGAVIGDEIFFTLERTNVIIKYDWNNDCISLVSPPSHNAYFVALMEMGDNALGFACIEGSSLYLWCRMVRSEEATEWMQCKVIDIAAVIPGANSENGACVVGSADGVDLIFVATCLGLFTFELKSGKVVKINDDHPGYISVYPYMSLCTPGSGTLSSLAKRVLADL